MLHLLILWLLTKTFNELKFLPPHAQEKKISLNLQQILTPPPAPKAQPIPQPVVEPSVPQTIVKPIIKKVEKPVIPKPIVKKEEVKKKLLDDSNKVYVNKNTKENNVTKVKPKPKKKVKTKKVVKKKSTQNKKIPTRKPHNKAKKRQKHPSNSLANALLSSGTSMYPQPRKHTSGVGSYGKKMIKKLYGSEFNTFSPAQKNFIRDNLRTISIITQRTLSRNGYPDVAVRTRQHGTNVVSFYLHPNGDISGLRLKKRLGYASLDKNTLKVIRLAYKNYPLPNKKTKIVFYVNYSLY